MFEPQSFPPTRHPEHTKPKSRWRRSIEYHAEREQEADEAHERQLRAEKAKQKEAEIKRKLESHDMEDGSESLARYGAWEVRRDVDVGGGEEGDRGAWKKAIIGLGDVVCYCSLFSMLVVVSMIWMEMDMSPPSHFNAT
jgi:hypothetical protein